MSTVKTYNVDSGDTTSLSLKTNGTTAVTINSSQNVGIGTNTPTTTLDVNGNIALTGSARRITADTSDATFSNRLMFQNSVTNGNTSVGAIPNGTATAANFRCYANNTASNTTILDMAVSGTESRITAGIVGTGTYGPFTIYTNNAERLRIDTNGDVGIGTNDPATPLHVNGTIRYTNRPAAGTITAIGYDANGDLKNSSSSLRYKYDVQDYGKGLSEVMQLRPVSFKFNGEERTNIGYIAEEVDALGLSEVMLYDDEGQPEGVLYANVVSLLTKAIQELNAKVEAQAAEIASLKGVQ